MLYHNYTPHEVVFYSEGDCVLDPVSRHYTLRDSLAKPILKLPSEGVARCTSTEATVSETYSTGIRTIRQSFGEVTGLPDYDQDPHVRYVVSAIVAQALAGTRDDLVIPSHTVYDDQGHIIGCAALAVI